MFNKNFVFAKEGKEWKEIKFKWVMEINWIPSFMLPVVGFLWIVIKVTGLDLVDSLFI
jgi:hypothetical protein